MIKFPKLKVKRMKTRPLNISGGNSGGRKAKVSRGRTQPLRITSEKSRNDLARRLKANGTAFARGTGYKGPVV